MKKSLLFLLVIAKESVSGKTAAYAAIAAVTI
jgi:hypothetical protein